MDCYFVISDLEMVRFPITACLRDASNPFGVPVNVFGKTKLIAPIFY